MDRVEAFNLEYGRKITPQKLKIEKLGLSIKAVATYLGVSYLYLWQTLAGYSPSSRLLGAVDQLIVELEKDSEIGNG